MTEHPLVSIVCLCYNHEPFIREALHSVISQRYSNIEIILVDDASTDGSTAIIQELSIQFPKIKTLLLKENVGNCKAFNRGLAMTTGDFIVDFATDDVMHPDRIAKQITLFGQLSKSVGVVFTDAVYIDEAGKTIRQHYEYLFKKSLIRKIPEGDLYADVLGTYFIASPTMLVKREVFTALNGYDEHLSYEDFDFWVRSSRDFHYAFLNEPLTYIRKSRHSLSTRWYTKGDPQLYSTYLVCEKAVLLNRNDREKAALVKRVKFEFRQSVFSENVAEAVLFYNLLKVLSKPGPLYGLLYGLNLCKLPLAKLRKLYHRLRYH